MQSNIEGDLIDSPVMTGDAFVADKNFLESIGSYDDGMKTGNGETLELSLRTWMCGGKIQVVSCSRIAVTESLLPQPIDNPGNFHRIIDLWFETDHQRLIDQHTKFEEYVRSTTEVESARIRKQNIKKIAECKDMRWYLSNPGKNIVQASPDVYSLGKLKNVVGYCAHAYMTPGAKGMDEYIGVQLCRPHIYEPDMLYEVTYKGRYMTRKGLCLELLEDFSVKLKTCDDSNQAQGWKLYNYDMLFNIKYRDICLVQKSVSNQYFLHGEPCHMNPESSPLKASMWKISKF